MINRGQYFTDVPSGAHGDVRGSFPRVFQHVASHESPFNFQAFMRRVLIAHVVDAVRKRIDVVFYADIADHKIRGAG